jgi:hypothetical protein
MLLGRHRCCLCPGMQNITVVQKDHSEVGALEEADDSQLMVRLAGARR